MPLRVLSCLALLVGLVGPLAAADLVATTDPLTPAEELKKIKLPPGFVMELVACEPTVHKPMNLAFDARGRLWVTSSLEYPFPVKDKPGRDQVVVLEDFGPDGKARKTTVFADGLNIPMGVLPLPDCKSALVFSIDNGVGQLLRLTDADGDGKADKKEVVFTGFGTRDTHGNVNGLTLNTDGWVYSCHGFSNDSAIKGTDGQELRMNSGNTWRFRPDGSHCEAFTRGQVNPFGLALDHDGNFYSADCHSRPLTQLLRGATYQSFGKPHDGIGFGPDMMTHDHASTGICGPVFLSAETWPAEFRGQLLCCNVVTSRINRDRIDRTGSSPKAIEQPDFAISDDPWFRPVYLTQGADGCLYVADFYNRIIGHYEVPLTHPGRDRERGRIWRIRYAGPDGKAEAPKAPHGGDFTTAKVEELVADLNSPNVTTRLLAFHELNRRPQAAEAARAAFDKPAGPTQAVMALWLLDRLGKASDADVKAALESADTLRRVHALRLFSERGEWSAELADRVRGRLADPDPTVRRCAADALARHPSTENVGPLAGARKAVPAGDNHLLHVIRMAVREQLRRPDVWARLPDTPEVQEAVADVALGVPSEQSAAYLLARARAGKVPPEFAQHAARFGNADTQAALAAWLKSYPADDLRAALGYLTAVQKGTQERGGTLDPAVVQRAGDLVGKALANADGATVQAGIDAANTLRQPAFRDPLAGLLARRDGPEPQRLACVAALINCDAAGSVAPLAKALGDAGEALPVRERAAAALGELNRPDAQEVLLKVLPTAPARLATAVAAALGGNKEGAEKLLALVATGKATPRLLQEKAVETRLANAKVPDLAKRIAELTKGLPSADARLAALLGSRRAGYEKTKADPALGAKVFAANCAACHQIGGQGAKIGPQLDGVGVRGVERLLEDTLDPNRNVDQAFRTTILGLKDGKVVNGLLLREEGKILVLADNQGKEVRIDADNVDERSTSLMSPMPANFDQKIAEGDFYHLLAYLLSQRAKDAPPK